MVGITEQDTSNSEQFFDKIYKQIEWAIHMGIPAVILPPPPTGAVMDYARIVHSLAIEAQSSNLQIWVKTYLTETSLEGFGLLHQFCDGLSNIGMILEMESTPALASSPAATVASQMVLIHKAIGMQLKAVIFPTKVFLTNKKGYPAMAKSHQVIFSEILRRIGRTVRILVDGPSVHQELPSCGVTKCVPYLQYIQHIRSREEVKAALDTEEASLETAYLDSLQRPLQPLKDHLEFSMYETFEKDPVKYAKYQEAVNMALKSGVASMELSPDAPKLITIAVAGAGRGPLVMRSINAFRQLEVPQGCLRLKVYAIEKNPSAVIYLESMAKLNPDWQGIVKVIKTDARGLQLSQLDDGNKIDIVVSELLGSFGDNELSPECLDPLLESECCKPTTISIPMQYTTYLAPISSVRLHTDAKQQAFVPHDGAQPLGLQRAMETSYVVRTHAASQTHNEQLCWTFDHPKKEQSNERVATLEFATDPTFAAGCGCGYGPVNPDMSEIVAQAPSASSSAITTHGLLGSFTAVLFAQGESRCEISIAPHRFSTGMFSWFPIYFPFREPLRVPANSNVSVKMWRKCAEGRVWYEWCAMVHRKGEVIQATPIHNPNGRSSYVTLS